MVVSMILLKSYISSDCYKISKKYRSSILKVEDRKFDRKVREALETQFQGTSPHEHGYNHNNTV